MFHKNAIKRLSSERCIPPSWENSFFRCCCELWGPKGRSNVLMKPFVILPQGSFLSCSVLPSVELLQLKISMLFHADRVGHSTLIKLFPRNQINSLSQIRDFEVRDAGKSFEMIHRRLPHPMNQHFNPFLIPEKPVAFFIFIICATTRTRMSKLVRDITRRWFHEPLIEIGWHSGVLPCRSGGKDLNLAARNECNLVC